MPWKGGVVAVALWAFKILPTSTTLGPHYSAPGFLLAIILLVVVSLLTKPAPKENIARFFSAFTDVYEDEELDNLPSYIEN